MVNVYLAGPLFSLAERAFNIHLAAAIQARLPESRVILPQERAEEFLHQEDGFRAVFKDCLSQIESADAVVAILDGPDADSGTSLEVGFALARTKPIVGIRTDPRVSEERGLNLMLAQACDVLILAHRTSLETLADRVVVGLLEALDVAYRAQKLAKLR